MVLLAVSSAREHTERIRSFREIVSALNRSYTTDFVVDWLISGGQRGTRLVGLDPS